MAVLSFGGVSYFYLPRQPESKGQAVDVAVIGAGLLLSILALSHGAGLLLLVLTVLYAFLSIRMEEASILDFLRCAVCFLLLHQQYYEWKEP